MKCPPEYWIWMQRTIGSGRLVNNIFTYFKDPRELYEAGRDRWAASGIPKTTIEKLASYSPSQSYDIMRRCRENGWTIITCDDDEKYPYRLHEIYDYPLVLYVWGDAGALLSPVCISVVGTRQSSEYGLAVTESLAYSLAKAGVTVVSGGALGIDCMAHTGALKADGTTIAFLGCGLGYPYLNENGGLRRKIARNGAVVSEFPPFTPPSKHTFPVRNRLISGISLGVVVIEAGEKSGSLITAKYALEQGRDVFAIPGNVMNSNYFGTNALIRDGAKAVFSCKDVLDEYTGAYGQYIKAEEEYVPLQSLDGENGGDMSFYEPPRKTKKGGRREEKKKSENIKTEARGNTKNKNENSVSQELLTNDKNNSKTDIPSYATETARSLLAYFGSGSKLADELVLQSGLSAEEVLSALTELELYGCIRMQSGQRYILADG